MSDTKDELKRIKELLAAKLHYSFINDTIPKPLIDEDKLAIIYFLSSKNNQSKGDNDDKIMAIMLMQIALDIHDQIPNENDIPLKLAKKQMKVLMGDYYSSLYYYVLAETNHIELIQEIALSNKVINEHKVNLYDGKMTNLDEFYFSLATIESELFTSFAIYSKQEYLVPIIKNLFLYNRLLREKQCILKDDYSFLYHYLEKFISFENRLFILHAINEKIDECIYHIEDSLHAIPYEDHQLKRYINKKLELFDKSYIAEEG